MLHAPTNPPNARRPNALPHEPSASWSTPRTGEACADLDIGLIYTYERAYLDKLLPQLRDSGSGLRMRLILVENASADGVDAWRPLFEQGVVLRNAQRLGYAANLNRILSAATSPYVLLLNSDMEFDPAEQCLAKMVRFMDAHPECGLSSCGVYHTDGGFAHPARRWQTPRVVLGRRLGLGRAVVDRYLYRDRPHDASFACDWVSGCFMLVRRAAIEQVGPFDTRFGKYFEDVDICQPAARLARCGATRLGLFPVAVEMAWFANARQFPEAMSEVRFILARLASVSGQTSMRARTGCCKPRQLSLAGATA